MRTRTFYPRLGLVQVSWADRVVLLDAVRLERWEPWIELITASEPVKILHSPSEDLEVFQHLADVLPDPLFDTQVAATLAGLGGTMGYQKLVAEVVGVDLPKGEQRSNWLRRPLTDSQRLYAALDVVYLLEIAEHVGRKLVDMGRWSWLEEEMDRQREQAVQRQRPELQYERLARPSMKLEELRVLWSLNLWREHQARRRDLPRRFVLGDDVLLEIARKRPRTAARLRSVSSLQAADRKRYGSALVEAVEEGIASEADLEPPASVSGRRSSTHRRLVDRARAVLEECGGRLDLPVDFLLTRREIDRLADSVRAGQPWRDELGGWRREVLEQPLAAALDG